MLVPEQFSYETERAYYHALGIRRADRVQVLSFKRLSDEVFREYGGLAGETAGDPAKLLAMKLALQDCKGELRLYAPVDGAKSYTGVLLPLGEDGSVRICCAPDGSERSFPRAAVASLRTRYSFDDEE